MDRLQRGDELPSFGTSASSSANLETRLSRMELNHENLMKENTKLMPNAGVGRDKKLSNIETNNGST